MTDQQPMSQDPKEGAPPLWPASYAGSAPVPPPGAAYPQPPAYSSGTRTSTNAIVALVLAVISWAVCPIVPAIVALVFASMASKEIEASEGRVEGKGLVTAAKIVAWINIGVMAAAVVVTVFVIVVVAIVGSAN